jgi:photosystem II stability/assembly factor-like uncharacterized protein
MTNSIKYKFLLALLAVATMGIAPSASAIDLLDLPAVQSGIATRALLLDVTPRGENGFVAVGEHGVILVSEDGGESWTQANVPASVTLTGVFFSTAEAGWAGGDAVDETALEDAEFMLEEAEFMLEGAVDDTSGGPVRPLLDVWFRNTEEGFVVGSYGMLLHTVDGGQTWELVSDRMDNAGAFHLNQVLPAPDGTLFIAGEAGFIYRSMDGGENWDTLEPGYEGSFYGVVVVPDGPDNYELLAYGLRGNLFNSMDKGDTWSAVDSGTTITLTTGMTLRDGAVALAGQGGIILTRPAGQQSFTMARNPDRRVVSGIAQQSDGHLLLVGLGGVRLAMPDGSPLETETGTP